MYPGRLLRIRLARTATATVTGDGEDDGCPQRCSRPVDKWRRCVSPLLAAAMALTCVHNYVKAPHVMCTTEVCNSPSSQTMATIFPRAVAVACLVSRTVAAYQDAARTATGYVRRIDEYESQFQAASAAERGARRLFVGAVIALYAAIIVPMNVYRLCLLNGHHNVSYVLWFFALMYVQNASLCVTEIGFVGRCFGLYQKYRAINGRMSALKARTIAVNRYPPVLKSDDADHDPTGLHLQGSDRGDSGLPKSQPSPGWSDDRVEMLMLRHQFVSGAVADLNRLYGVQLSASLSSLFVMTLCDIFEVVSAELNATKTTLMLYGWMLQYAFRFCTIVQMTHATTKQAHKSKSLITDINNRYLDSNTKDELQLFLNQLSTRSIEFTTFDFFILNTRLITSAIMAGTTYFIILLQFESIKNNTNNSNATSKSL